MMTLMQEDYSIKGGDLIIYIDQNAQFFNIQFDMHIQQETSPESPQLTQSKIPKESSMDNFQRIIANNQLWAQESVNHDPHFFTRLVEIQRPEYLWIGCSDSRVPANDIVGLKPGELFVHRNIANQVPPSDINVLAVIQYSVQVLKVKDIIVAGHYGCGGIKAAFKKHDHGPLEAWLSHIRNIRGRYRSRLTLTPEKNENLLTELNVQSQVMNIARVPIVQIAWKNGQQLRIHGLVYNLKDGLLKDMGLTLSGLEQVPEQYRVI